MSTDLDGKYRIQNSMTVRLVVLMLTALLLGRHTTFGDPEIVVASGTTLSEYDATTGTANPGFTSPSFSEEPTGLAVLNNILYAANLSTSTMGEYNALTGGTINGSFITGFGMNVFPYTPVISGSIIYIPNTQQGSVGEYNVLTGGTIDATFINQGSSTFPTGQALSGSDLYVLNGGGVVDEYNATTGGIVSEPLLTAPSTESFSPLTLTISGNDLFIATSSTTIGEYNATTGALITGTFITGLDNPLGMAISGTDIYVANTNSGSIGEYSLATGAPVNPDFITGLNSPTEIVIVVPEPRSTVLFLGAAALLFWLRRRGRTRMAPARRSPGDCG